MNKGIIMKKLECILSILFVFLLSTQYIDAKENADESKTTNTVINLKLKKDTVVKIAEIILEDIYGKRVLEEKPWIITEMPDAYKIMGTPKYSNGKGGVAEIIINKADGRVEKCIHGK